MNSSAARELERISLCLNRKDSHRLVNERVYGIDSFEEQAMPKPYSVDFRGRVVDEIASGASRREAAAHYGISPSVVVIWMQRFEATGSVAAKHSGGSASPLEVHGKFLLDLIKQKPDLTFGRNRYGDAQTQDCWQPYCGLAF